ncbi:MAG TPA: PadR family transcriptional regulator [Thermomicrobiales bacterium]|nr:PadR family transcriptional regulator [Thermomicrobiales bacterium]
MTGEMPAEHAILGLLALHADQAPGYGYDLARSFGEGQPLAEILRLEPGMLYHHLKKLERAGWVEAEVETQASRPARRTYRLAAAGRAELRRWLGEPVARTREIRLEFLVKLHFARRLDPARAARLVAEQRDMCRRLYDSLTGQLAQAERAAAAAGDDVRFGAAVLRLRALQTRAAIDWLDSLQSDDASPEAPTR